VDLITFIKDKNQKAIEWMNAGENRWTGLLSEDPEWWAERGVYTIKNYERWTVEATMSDLHKEAYGFRPRGYDFAAMSDDDLFALADKWSADADRAYQEELAAEQARVDDLNATIDEMIALGAGDRATAIRWLVDAEDLDDWADVDYNLWDMNIPKELESEFSPAIREALIARGTGVHREAA